ncbi:MAG: ATP-binding protein [Rhodobacter sp.]|nr:ATP-binding protein [Paracoccaceae bacterium]MCC0072589.1 ATP-binding protein [Rhodobacter sp.]
MPDTAFPSGVAGPSDTGEPIGRWCFARRFPAGDRETRRVLADLIDGLGQAGVGEDDRSNAELILAEVLNNIAEHAYADGVGPVELRVEVRRSGLACQIADRGQPMPASDAPDPDLPLIAPPDHLPEGGFGWHIIRCLTSDLRYARDRGWNRLTMHMPWSGYD